VEGKIDQVAHIVVQEEAQMRMKWNYSVRSVLISALLIAATVPAMADSVKIGLIAAFSGPFQA